MKTLAFWESYRDELQKAIPAAVQGKSYTISSGGTSRTFTRNDLKVLRDELNEVNSAIDQLKGSTNRIKFGANY